MIRTYELSHESKTPLYVQLYEAIRADILSGSLPGGEKLPSKRALAEHLSLSKITVETAYAQLLDEGYLTSRERSGYFVAHMPLLAKAPARHTPETTKAPEIAPRQNAAAELFPFSVWASPCRMGDFFRCAGQLPGSWRASGGLWCSRSKFSSARARSIFTRFWRSFSGADSALRSRTPATGRWRRSTAEAARRSCRYRWTKAASA